MSDEKKIEDVADEHATRDPEDAPDLGTAWGRFVNEKDMPGTPSHMVHGLLSETHPSLKAQVFKDFESLMSTVDVVNNLLSQVMSTPEGRKLFQKDLEKWQQRQASEK